MSARLIDPSIGIRLLLPLALAALLLAALAAPGARAAAAEETCAGLAATITGTNGEAYHWRLDLAQQFLDLCL